MTQDAAFIHSKICEVVSDIILPEGWSGSEDVIRELLVKERRVWRFKAAFNQAVFQCFSDNIAELFDDYKIDEKMNTIRTKGKITIPRVYNEKDIQKYMMTQGQKPGNIKEKLEELIALETQSIDELKQKLKFQMRKLEDTQAEVTLLLRKAKSVTQYMEKDLPYLKK